MKKFTVILALIARFAPDFGLGQVDKELLEFKAPGYEYEFVKTKDRLVKDFFEVGLLGWTKPLDMVGQASFLPTSGVS